VLRRRKAETELGVQALANLKWRDCIAVVLEALHRDGYQRSAVAEAPAGGATEVMLTPQRRGRAARYKHGTAYHLTERNVREFVNDVSLNGAREGILVTLGSAEPGALRVAATHNVQLIGGQACGRRCAITCCPRCSRRSRAGRARTRNGLVGGALAAWRRRGCYCVLGDRARALRPWSPIADVARAAAAARRAPTRRCWRRSTPPRRPSRKPQAARPEQRRAPRRSRQAHRRPAARGPGGLVGAEHAAGHLRHAGDDARTTSCSRKSAAAGAAGRNALHARAARIARRQRPRVRWRLR
jgi:hypothetical protein